MDTPCQSACLALTLASPGAVTDGVTLYFFLKKCRTFSVIVTTFTLPAFQLIVCPVFFLISAANKIRLSLGCHPLDGVSRGGPLLPPSNDATGV